MDAVFSLVTDFTERILIDLDFLEKLENGHRNRGEIYFYWVLGHTSDVNSYYKSISKFILNLDMQNIAYIILDDQTLHNPVANFQKLNEVWARNIHIFGEYEIQDLIDKIKLKEFLRNFVVFFDTTNSTLTLEDLEMALNNIMLIFTKIFYKEYFIRKGKNVFISRFKGFLYKIIHWFNDLIHGTLSVALKSDEFVEKIFFYDQPNEEQLLFLSFLRELGFDVLIVDTTGNICLRPAHIALLPIELIEYDYKSEPRSLSNIMTKFDQVSTTAVEATKEISDQIFGIHTGSFKPKQLIQFDNQPILLNTIFEETRKILFSEIRYREGFEIIKNKVYSPQIFAKIDGVKDRDINKNVDLFNGFFEPEYKEWIISNLPYEHFEKIKNTIDYREISIDSLINNFDPILAGKLDKTIKIVTDLDNNFWVKSQIRQQRKATKIIESAIKYLLTDKKFCFLIKKQDIPFLSPKLILYDLDLFLSLNKRYIVDYKLIVCTMLMFCYLIGFDVVVFSFMYDAIIENYVNQSMFQKILLEDVASQEEATNIITDMTEYMYTSRESEKKDSSTFSKIIGFFTGE